MGVPRHERGSQIGVLEASLEAGLLDIGEADERLALLRRAASDVAKTLEKDRQRSIGLTIAAIDPTSESSGRDLSDVIQAVSKHWTTHRSRFSDDPRFLYRAVGLASLELASTSSAEIRTIVYLIGKNIAAFAGAQAEAAVVQPFLTEIGAIIEKHARASFYQRSPSVDVPRIEANNFTVDVAKLNVADIVETGTTGMATYQGQYFNMGQVLKPGLTQIFEGLAKLLVTANQSVIASTVEDLAKQVDNALRSLPASEGDLRLDIIWWAKAGYSPSLRSAYRDLSPDVMVVAAAIDIFSEMPDAIPEAVEFVLRDVVRRGLRDRDETATVSMTWSSLLAALGGNLDAQKIGRQIPKCSRQDGRVSALEIVRSVISDGQDASSAMSRFGGIPTGVDISLEDISSWLFSDALATRLAITKSGKAK